MFAIGSLLDPFAAYNDGFHTSNVNGRTERPSRLNASERTMVFVSLGQSLMAASENANYTVTNSTKVDNLNLYDGGIYAAQDPLLGCGAFNAAGCWFSRFGDKLINAGICDRVILAPIARGSTTVQDWQVSGFMHQSLLAVSARLAALGLTPTAYMWGQGEANRGAITRAEYSAALSSIITAVRSKGFVAPWLVGKSTSADGSADVTIRLAIDDVVATTNNTYAGADHDSITLAGRYDGVHFNATGADAAAGKWRDAVVAAGMPPF